MTDRDDAVRRSGDLRAAGSHPLLTRAPVEQHCQGMPTCSAGTGLIASPCPSPPASGGRGRGPAWRRGENEWGSSAVRAGGPPHLTPTFSAPEGGEGIFEPPV